MLFVPNALINSPPATNRSDKAQGDQQHQNLFVVIYRVSGHERNEKDYLEDNAQQYWYQPTQ